MSGSLEYSGFRSLRHRPFREKWRIQRQNESKEKVCNGTSVGILVWHRGVNPMDDRLLLALSPKMGQYAPIAGHLDGEGPNMETNRQAAVRELKEEANITIENDAALSYVTGGRAKNPCSRGGEEHNWSIFETNISDERAVTTNVPDEVSEMKFFTRRELAELIKRSLFHHNDIFPLSEERLKETPVLSKVWLDWFSKLDIPSPFFWQPYRNFMSAYIQPSDRRRHLLASDLPQTPV